MIFSFFIGLVLGKFFKKAEVSDLSVAVPSLVGVLLAVGQMLYNARLVFSRGPKFVYEVAVLQVVLPTVAVLLLLLVLGVIFVRWVRVAAGLRSSRWVYVVAV